MRFRRFPHVAIAAIIIHFIYFARCLKTRAFYSLIYLFEFRSGRNRAKTAPYSCAEYVNKIVRDRNSEIMFDFGPDRERIFFVSFFSTAANRLSSSLSIIAWIALFSAQFVISSCYNNHVFMPNNNNNND